jgi:hypothetical protein
LFRIKGFGPFGEGERWKRIHIMARFWHKAAVFRNSIQSPLGRHGRPWFGRAWAPVPLSFTSPYHLPEFSADLPDLDAFTADFW